MCMPTIGTAIEPCQTTAYHLCGRMFGAGAVKTWWRHYQCNTGPHAVHEPGCQLGGLTSRHGQSAVLCLAQGGLCCCKPRPQPIWIHKVTLLASCCIMLHGFILHASCLMPHASCFMLHAPCLVPRASCLMPHAPRPMPHAACLMPLSQLDLKSHWT